MVRVLRFVRSTLSVGEFVWSDTSARCEQKSQTTTRNFCSIFHTVSTNTNCESSCETVLSSTRQHDALVDPTTREHDDPGNISLRVWFCARNVSWERKNTVFLLQKRNVERYSLCVTPPFFFWRCVETHFGVLRPLRNFFCGGGVETHFVGVETHFWGVLRPILGMLIPTLRCWDPRSRLCSIGGDSQEYSCMIVSGKILERVSR